MNKGRLSLSGRIIDESDAQAVNLLDQIFKELLADKKVWDIAEAPDGHSLAWHGANILRDARNLISDGLMDRNFLYRPYYTTDVSQQETAA